MFSQDPLPDLFDIQLTADFFDKDISAQFNKYLRMIDGHIDEIDVFVNETIQGLNIPGWGYDRVQQQSTGYQDGKIVPYQNWFMPNVANTNLVETKEFEIVFRHTDSYLNYYYMLLHFHKWFSFDNTSKFCMQVLPVYLKMPSGIKICKLLIKRVMFIGMNGISLGYDKLNREFSTFSCRFGFDSMDLEFDLPESTSNGHIITVDTIFGDVAPTPAEYDVTLSATAPEQVYFKFRDEAGQIQPIASFEQINASFLSMSGIELVRFKLGAGFVPNPRDPNVVIMIKDISKMLPAGSYRWQLSTKLFNKPEQTLITGNLKFV